MAEWGRVAPMGGVMFLSPFAQSKKLQSWLLSARSQKRATRECVPSSLQSWHSIQKVTPIRILSITAVVRM